MAEHFKDFVVGKNSVGKEKLENNPALTEDEDIFCGTISQEEDEFIEKNISDKAFDDHGIDFAEYEYDEIPNELVDYFIDLIGNNKDKCPVFYQALMYAKESGDIIQVCF